MSIAMNTNKQIVKSEDVLKKEVCFIRPIQRKNDYWHEAIRGSGYTTFIPYKDFYLPIRLIREIWFKLNLPAKEIWFNKEVLKTDKSVYIVKDPLMIVEYFSWLRRMKPNARILLDFDNRAGKLFDPNLITDPSIEKWTYDDDDSVDFNMKLKPKGYLEYYRIKKCDYTDYDIVFVGKDLGRYERLLELKKIFENKGLCVLFRICPNRDYLLFQKKGYKPTIHYKEYLKLISRSKAILNITPDGQKGMTMREYEAVFDGIKCITTNKAVKCFELYDPSRYFILGEDDLESIVGFLNTEFKPIREEELSKYTLDEIVKGMVGYKAK